MSKYLRIKCECGNEQNIFGNATSEINCLVCGATLAKPTGSRTQLVGGKIIKVL